jgi:DNA mismatch repair protein MutL
MNRPRIRQLDSTLINQIAAGEVIERPAAALKELVENALDANAQRIDIVLRNGGKSMIQIADDGIGMTESELLMAIQRHATSKLPLNDLFTIHTLGFRGEALPSIGSVSRLQITSMPRDVEQSTPMTLFIEGGVIHPARPDTGTYGTRIVVKDLFFATPARLKFLKSDAAELSACVDCIKRLSLAHSTVAFRMIHDDRVMVDLPAQTEMGKRFADVLGEKTMDNVRLIDHAHDDVRLTGVVSLPTFNKSQANDQYFFVNNRPVKDKIFISAVRAAYADVLERNRHPVCILFLTMDTNDVDVNVHPAKAEVRFHDASLIRSFIIASMGHTLDRHAHETSSHLTGEALTRFSAPHLTAAAPLKQYTGSRSSEYTPSPSIPSPHRSMGALFSPPSFPKVFSDAPITPAPIKNVTHIPPETWGYLGAAKAQIKNSYIITENDEEIILIDQHAAHERILFEKLKHGYTSGQGIARQALLIPVLRTLTPHQHEIFNAESDILKRLGFDYDVFGDTLSMRAIPHLLSHENQEQLIDDVIHDCSEPLENRTFHEHIMHRLATYACHGSIRFGRSLSLPEMNALLRQIESFDRTGQCNHGRPTYIKLALSDIEKLFNRS